MSGERSEQPFFSIGVTTFNRINLLKQSITALLHQDFADFEIIIGNDYLPEPLTLSQLGVDDDRVVLVNNVTNLGELENMNSLLKKARGIYFSWQFDDDICAPGLLRKVYNAITSNNFPLAAFTSFKYIYGESDAILIDRDQENIRLLPGRAFLRAYLSGAIRALGLGGFHNTEYLRSLGGAERLSAGHMALYSEYLLIVHDGLLDNVLYLNDQLIANRVHGNSWSSNNSQVELFKEAGINLLKETVKTLTSNDLREDLQKNLNSLLNSVVSVVVVKSLLAGTRIKTKELSAYLYQIEEVLTKLEDNNYSGFIKKSIQSAKVNIPIFRLKAWLKIIIPDNLLKYMHVILSFISPITNKSF